MKRPPLIHAGEALLLILAAGGLLFTIGSCVLQPGQDSQPAPVPPTAGDAADTRSSNLAPAASTAEPPAIHLTGPVKSDNPDRADAAIQTIADVTALDIQEGFEHTAVGQLPAGWSQWPDTRLPSFAAATLKPLNGSNSLGCAGVTHTTARTWLEKPALADVQCSAAIYLDSLVPAQVLVRGRGLDTATPTFYGVSVARGLEVELVSVVKGEVTRLSSLKSAGYVSQKWVRLTLCVQGDKVQVQLARLDTGQYLDGKGGWQAAPTWTLTVTDDTIAGAGHFGLGRPARYPGTIYFDDFTATLPAAGNAPPAGIVAKLAANPEPGATQPQAPAPATPAAAPAADRTEPVSWRPPEIPRHHPHIRIALLAYAGTPMGAFEDRLLRQHVDLVLPNAAYLRHIHDVAPQTPQLLYTNTSNLYRELLSDWLTYADTKGLSREVAFFHAVHPIPFRGDSPSSQPVTWFWGVYRGGQPLTNLTSAAHGKSERVVFGSAGESLFVGHVERFREVNLRLVSGAGAGWSAGLEYPTAVTQTGAPANWAPLTTLADSTNHLTRSGQIAFDPPADWKSASVGGSARLFYVRFHTTGDGAAPVASGILGRDYVGANGTSAGTIPAFDAGADRNGDGYLDDTEYAHRAAGKDARFLYESRVFCEGYGQMRFCTRLADPGFRAWCVEYNTHLLAAYPLGGGLFMDNAGGKLPVRAADVLEPVTTYGADCGAALHAVAEAVAPRPVLANTGGGGANADPIVRQNPAYFEEFAIRPLSHPWVFFEELAGLVARRAKLSTPAPYAVIDSHAQGGSPTDPRLQLATLAYYYLLADPDSTFLMFYGGQETNTSWERHWTQAVAYDIGRPTAAWSQFATGTDPANANLTYKVYQRPYDNALVLFKPLSYRRASRERAGLGDDTATRHDLPGTYRPLGADGTLGTPVTSILLRNGEGAILVKTKP